MNKGWIPNNKGWKHLTTRGDEYPITRDEVPTATNNMVDPALNCHHHWFCAGTRDGSIPHTHTMIIHRGINYQMYWSSTSSSCWELILRSVPHNGAVVKRLVANGGKFHDNRNNDQHWANKVVRHFSYIVIMMEIPYLLVSFCSDSGMNDDTISYILQQSTNVWECCIAHIPRCQGGYNKDWFSHVLLASKWNKNQVGSPLAHR